MAEQEVTCYGPADLEVVPVGWSRAGHPELQSIEVVAAGWSVRKVFTEVAEWTAALRDEGWSAPFFR